MSRIGSLASELGAGILPTQRSQFNLRLLYSVRSIANRGASTNQASRDRLDLALSQVFSLTENETFNFSPVSSPLAAGLSGSPIGLNEDQVARLDVGTVRTAARYSGFVSQRAAGAELTLSGATAGQFQSSEQFEIQGSRGTATLTIDAGESLKVVVERINDITDATGVLARQEGDDILLRSVHSGSQESIQVTALNATASTSVNSNVSQIQNVTISSIATNTSQTLSGSVTRAAERAQLVYQGELGSTVSDTATFSLTGELGTASLGITQGESLDDVAARVNQLSSETGVTAAREGSTLVFSSDTFGSQANISIELTDIAVEFDVEGVEPNQLESFTVNSAAGGEHTISGSVTQAATEARLAYDGIFGRTRVAATFTLSGSLGSASISVSSFERLTDVRDRINEESSSTGVTASVSGDELLLQSEGVGSDATVVVEVTSGTFATSGGNGDGTATGGDARATINGQELTGSGNDFEITDASGTFAFSVKSGFQGSLDPITVTATAGEFQILGGDGEGSASGVDAEAAINNQSIVAVGNRFTIEDEGLFEVTFQAGFSGEFDDIVINSQASLRVQGGSSRGQARGQDGIVVINGTTYRSDNDRFEISTADSDFSIEFKESFSGAFDAFQIRPPATAGSDPVETSLSHRRSLAELLGQERTSSSSIRNIRTLLDDLQSLVLNDPAESTATLVRPGTATASGRQRILEILGLTL